MFESKYLDIIYGEDVNEYPVKFSIDWYKLKANLKRRYKDNNIFHLSFTLLGYMLYFEFKWGHIERPMTDDEAKRQEAINKMFENWKI